jgi:hypothetical protein
MQRIRQAARAGLLSAVLLLTVLAIVLTADSGEFQVHQDSEGKWDYPAAAIDPNGNAIVVWQRESGVFGDSYDIYARRYDITGTPLSGEFLVHTTTSNLQRRPDVAVDADGDFVVV